MTEISIVDFLGKEGYHPTKVSGHKAWYKSPWRNEDIPSLMVNTSTNKWVDWSDRKNLNGTVIGLCMEMYNCDAKKAYNILEGKENLNKVKPKPIDKRPNIKLTGTSGFDCSEGYILKEYLKTRGIDFKVAEPYIKVVRFKIRKANDWGSEQFAIGFKTDKGGYELRNNNFKGCIPLKGITTIKNGSPNLVIMEGFMDYLSALQYYGRINYDVVVLNSLSFIGDIPEYRRTVKFFDNDTAGYNANLSVKGRNGSVLYRGCSDFNDFLLSK